MDRDLKALTDRLLSTYQKFCLNEVLHEKVDNKLYKEFISMWDTILLGLETDYMMGLARFFERPREIEKTISIHSFFDYQFKKHDEVIKKIINWRNKFFAHHDAKASHNSGTFLARNKLNRQEIKTLFDTVIEVVNQLGSNFNQSGLNQKFEKVRNETRNECEEWLKSFRKT